MSTRPALLSSIDELAAFITDRRYTKCIILADSNTVEHCLHALTLNCAPLNDAEVIEVDPGEGSKSLEVAAGIWQTLLEMGADRHTCLVCLGGGMVTDLGGFIASTFKRGISYIYVPTTLLGLVDASIGGKTGINLGEAKNQIGTFSWPDARYFSTAWLETLPQREFMAGYAEMYKHALIADAAHLKALEEGVRSGREALYPLIPASAEIKNCIVLQDPHERDVRKTLNFGHTAGHAFESLSFAGSQPLLHGEAVAAGMCVALRLSADLKGFDPGLAMHSIEHLNAHFNISGCFTADRTEELWAIMQHDKKNQSGNVLFVLLEAIAEPVIDCPVTFDDFRTSFGKLVLS